MNHDQEQSVYSILSSVDVNQLKAKKGKFDYLSWADAVDVLQQHFPTATWEVRDFGGLPYIGDHVGAWVCVTVTIRDVSRTQWHPVLDHNNKRIPPEKLDVFAVNKSIQRCLAKAIALHGLGLYIFRGEDFPAPPTADGNHMATAEEIKTLRDLIEKTDTVEDEFLSYLGLEGLEDCTEVMYRTRALPALQHKLSRMGGEA